MQLSDVVRECAGYPIDLSEVVRVLEIADDILPGGRDCGRDLTEAEVDALMGNG